GGGLVVMPEVFTLGHPALLSLLYSETLILAWLLVKLAFLLALWCGLVITAVGLAPTGVVAGGVCGRRADCGAQRGTRPGSRWSAGSRPPCSPPGHRGPGGKSRRPAQAATVRSGNRE